MRFFTLSCTSAAKFPTTSETVAITASVTVTQCRASCLERVLHYSEWINTSARPSFALLGRHAPGHGGCSPLGDICVHWWNGARRPCSRGRRSSSEPGKEQHVVGVRVLSAILENPKASLAAVDERGSPTGARRRAEATDYPYLRPVASALPRDDVDPRIGRIARSRTTPSRESVISCPTPLEAHPAASGPRAVRRLGDVVCANAFRVEARAGERAAPAMMTPRAAPCGRGRSRCRSELEARALLRYVSTRKCTP